MAILFFLVLFVGSAASWIPGTRQVEQIDPSPESALKRSARVEYTAVLRPEESGWVELTLLPIREEEGRPAAIAARLDLPGITAKPEEVGQVAALKDSVRFRWEFIESSPKKVEGKLWLYSGAERDLIWVKPLQVEVRGPGMKSVWVLRGVLLLCLAASAAYLLFVIKSTYSISIR
jgi:hypothetical protein